MTRSKQTGGNNGRYVLPKAYFGAGTDGYTSSSGFDSKSGQIAISEGVIHPNGKFAGPNLYPQQAGSRKHRRNTKAKSKKTNKRTNKTRSHSRKNRKTMRRNNKH